MCAELGRPVIICGYVHNNPLPARSTQHPLHIHFHSNANRKRGGPPLAAPFIASSLLDAAAARHTFQRGKQRFFFLSIFTTFCGRKFGNGNKYSWKKNCLWIMEHFKSIWFLRHFLVSHYSQLYSMLEWELVLSWGSFCSRISTLIVATDLGG